MNTIVKIAPVEKWCEVLRNHFASTGFPTFVGMTIEIDPRSFLVADEELHGCTTRFWKVTDACRARLTRIAGADGFGGNQGYVCEHLLELD